MNKINYAESEWHILGESRNEKHRADSERTVRLWSRDRRMPTGARPAEEDGQTGHSWQQKVVASVWAKVRPQLCTPRSSSQMHALRNLRSSLTFFPCWCCQLASNITFNNVAKQPDLSGEEMPLTRNAS